MPTTSTRMAIPIAALTDAADVPASIAALVNAIDPYIVPFAKGTLAARPAASAIEGKLYYATDNGILYFSIASVWQRVDLDLLNRVVALEAKLPAVFMVDQSSYAFIPTSDTRIDFDELSVAAGAWSGISVGADTWTIPVTGVYEYNLEIALRTSGSPIAQSTISADVRVGGVSFDFKTAFDPVAGAYSAPLVISGFHNFTSGDVVDCSWFAATQTNRQGAAQFGMHLLRT